MLYAILPDIKPPPSLCLSLFHPPPSRHPSSSSRLSSSAIPFLLSLPLDVPLCLMLSLIVSDMFPDVAVYHIRSACERLLYQIRFRAAPAATAASCQPSMPRTDVLKHITHNNT